jgi:hypothetical protein
MPAELSNGWPISPVPKTRRQEIRAVIRILIERFYLIPYQTDSDTEEGLTTGSRLFGFIDGPPESDQSFLKV